MVLVDVPNFADINMEIYEEHKLCIMIGAAVEILLFLIVLQIVVCIMK